MMVIVMVMMMIMIYGLSIAHAADLFYYRRFIRLPNLTKRTVTITNMVFKNRILLFISRVGIYVCVHVWVYMCVHVCVYVCFYVWVCVSMYGSACVCPCMCVYVC